MVSGENEAVPRRRIDIKLLLASLGIAAGLVLVVSGVRASVTGREEQNLPDEIESIDPVRGATQVPQQTNVFVDLIAGYEAVLSIDGIELPTVPIDGNSDNSAVPLPGQQISLPPGAVFEPGNVTLTFTPGDDELIDEFSIGQHLATVLYWKAVDGRNAARSFTWSFYVV